MELINVDGVVYEIGGMRIIDGISFKLEKEEFVSIIGPSGCGKSTLLRIMAGLIPPYSGSVRYMNKMISEPVREISFVFQDFALLPWLSNVDNVKIGLSAVKMDERRKDAVARKLLDDFGLNGFEDSYPNALSGGMKQRVGIARAVAQEPSVLLMDEPFSALDELTANTLRADILSMLAHKEIPVKLVVMVTHNVEEAVELSDRIVVLSNKPTKVKSIVDINIERPRNRHSRAFMRYVDRIYAELTR